MRKKLVWSWGKKEVGINFLIFSHLFSFWENKWSKEWQFVDEKVSCRGPICQRRSDGFSKGLGICIGQSLNFGPWAFPFYLSRDSNSTRLYLFLKVALSRDAIILNANRDNGKPTRFSIKTNKKKKEEEGNLIVTSPLLYPHL